MTRAIVRIPAPLRGLTDGADELALEGETVRDLLNGLGRAHAEALARVQDGEGRLRPFVNVYLGSKNVQTLGGLDAKVTEGAVVSIVPAVAGGAPCEPRTGDSRS